MHELRGRKLMDIIQLPALFTTLVTLHGSFVHIYNFIGR